MAAAVTRPDPRRAGHMTQVCQRSLVPGHAHIPQHERKCQASNGAKVSSIKRDSTTGPTGPDRADQLGQAQLGRLGRPGWADQAGPTSPCENFLYGFKAVRRAARAADSARSPSLPLALSLRRRQRRSAGAKDAKPWAALTYSSHRIPLGVSLLPLPELSRARAEPGVRWTVSELMPTLT